MRSLFALMAAVLLCGNVAQAQTTADHGYVQAAADLAFGNVSSQSYGAEAGFTIVPHLQIFVEGGRVNSVAGDAIGSAAQVIVTFLASSQGGATVTVREPVVFGAGGLRYLLGTASSRARPYLTAGAGMARVKQDVVFRAGGNDVTSLLPQMGIVLGSDLSGTFTKPLVTLGGGVDVSVWRHLVLDLQVRAGRIFADEQHINIGRAGLGLGFRF